MVSYFHSSVSCCISRKTTTGGHGRPRVRETCHRFGESQLNGNSCGDIEHSIAGSKGHRWQHHTSIGECYRKNPPITVLVLHQKARISIVAFSRGDPLYFELARTSDSNSLKVLHIKTPRLGVKQFPNLFFKFFRNIINCAVIFLHSELTYLEGFKFFRNFL